MEDAEFMCVSANIIIDADTVSANIIFWKETSHCQYPLPFLKPWGSGGGVSEIVLGENNLAQPKLFRVQF